MLVAGMVAAGLCAQALGEVGVPPLPTVSLPTVSVTTPSLPVPTTPAPPVPPPPPTPPVPAPAVPAPPVAVPVPTSPPPVRAPSTSGQGGSAPVAPPATGGISSTSSYSAERPRSPAEASSSQRRARVTRLKASPQRFRPGSKRRGTRITFRLTKPARVVFIVRGPAPSCDVVGRFTVRGHRGTNRVRFKGRVGRRTLAPGTYALTAHPGGRAQATGRVVVIVGDGQSKALQCSDLNQFAFLGTASIFGGGSPQTIGGSSTEDEPTAAPPTDEKKSRGVLPAIKKRISEIPQAIPRPAIPRDAPDTPPAILGLLALGLLALSGVAILVYVFRFVRGPHTHTKSA